MAPVTRSSVKHLPKIETKKEKKMIPSIPIKFKGKIVYTEEFVDIAMACDTMTKSVEASEEFLVLGFDIEWPFSFQTGSGKTSVMQISPNLDICYVFQFTKLRKLPKALTELLAHPKTRITGVNIKNDVRKLARDFSGVDAEKIIANCIDSGVFANKILPFQQRWSMLKLVEYLLKKTINKDNKVRMSQWHVSPLSKEQLEYAATDAYASLVLYLELKQREEKQQKEEKQQTEDVA